MPSVSVIIPTHSRPHLLPQAVASAHAAGTEVEVIVVDDASTDETAAVCRGLDGIKYVRLERNQGVAGARNTGLLASTAEYVAFLDDDDLRLPGSLDLQRAALAADPAAGFACGAMLLADQSYAATGEVSAPQHPGGDAFWELLEMDFPIMPLATLIRKECFLRVGLFRRNLSGIDDWDIFVRIAAHYHVVVMNQPVGIYRRPTPSSQQGSSAQAAQLRRAARHQVQLLRLPRAQAAPRSRRRRARRQTINRIADTLLWQAVQRIPEKEYRFACANILAALRLNPLRVARPGAYRKMLTSLAATRKTS
jgi:hypothetical protein